ncbi:MAG TPA: sigma 54 modulation/S30EA ribosomal C-terminal domain-containing protein [Gaiellaceae bacterium]|nr:sigma 54 modulation/S30EA ribosomal C-terminal domain-containing protein [Gaiellaceae bacterium]
MQLPLDVSVRGSVGEKDVRRLREKLLHALSRSPRPLLHAHATLLHEPGPAIEHPALAKASVELDGRVLRAHASAAHMAEAIDELEERLRRRIEDAFARARRRRRETGVAAPGEWRHGDLPTERPGYYPRPVEERRLLRRKTFALAPVTFDEAVSELEALDHDFYLFLDAETGEDALAFRPAEGQVERLDRPTAAASVEEAIERLDATGEPFVFFVDAERGRGCVVYRRYDGHYGLVEPAAEDVGARPRPS